MAIIKFDKKQFEKEIGKLDEKMKHKIAMFGTPIEDINKNEIEIEIFPNRPDLLSYHGYKRSFLAFLGKKTRLKNYQINKPEKDYRVKIETSVKNVRPYTVCAIVKDLKLDNEKIKEIIEIQEKLHITLGRKRKKIAIGIYPLEKIKLPITFKAMEPEKIKFVPLESSEEMSGLEILQRHPTGKEYAHLLSGKTKFPVFLDADENILSMPPIINSQLTGKVTEETKEIFVECSGFDFSVLNKCLNILITDFVDMGGRAYQMNLTGKIKKTTPDLSHEKKEISLENTNKLLGLNLNEKQLKNLIERMGYNYSEGKTEIPAWRTDILHEVDLIEDVAIAYGYDNIVPEIPKISTVGEESQKEVLKRKFSEILSGLKFLEVSNYHLTTKNDQFTKMGLNKKQEGGFIEVEETKTEYSVLRKDLTHYLLKTLAENVDVLYPQRIFEIGKVFFLKGKIHENDALAFAVSPGNFTEVKQIVEYFFKMLNLKVQFKELNKSPAHFIDGRTAEIILEGKGIGSIGEIHPKILNNWKTKMPVALCEISLEEILRI